jgi:hypothetical protein
MKFSFSLRTYEDDAQSSGMPAKPTKMDARYTLIACDVAIGKSSWLKQGNPVTWEATFHARVGVKSLTGEKYAPSASLSNACNSQPEVNVHLMIAIGVSLISVSRNSGFGR